MKYEITDHQFRKFQESYEVTFYEFLAEEKLGLLCDLPLGKDIWRHNPVLKQMICSRSIGKLIADLTKEPQIRVLMDLCAENTTIDLSKISFQGALCCAVFSPLDGSLTVYKTELPAEIAEKSYVVIYGKGNSRYVINENDPDSARLKKMGYVFGDRLKVEDFPFAYH